MRPQAETCSTIPAIAVTYPQRIARTQISVAKANEERVCPRPDIQTVKPHIKLCAIARLDRGVICRHRFIELWSGHVGCGAPRDFHHARVVDAKGPSRVGQGQLGICAGDEWASWRQRGPSHLFGTIGRKRHETAFSYSALMFSSFTSRAYLAKSSRTSCAN